jgi:hypothetical protein
MLRVKKKKESSFPRALAHVYEFVPLVELEFRGISPASRFSHGTAKSHGVSRLDANANASE